MRFSESQLLPTRTAERSSPQAKQVSPRSLARSPGRATFPHAFTRRMGFQPVSARHDLKARLQVLRFFPRGGIAKRTKAGDCRSPIAGSNPATASTCHDLQVIARLARNGRIRGFRGFGCSPPLRGRSRSRVAAPTFPQRVIRPRCRTHQLESHGHLPGSQPFLPDIQALQLVSRQAVDRKMKGLSSRPWRF